MTITAHTVTRYIDASGFVATCQTCAWRVVRRSREQREIDARAHETEGTLTVRRADRPTPAA